MEQINFIKNIDNLGRVVIPMDIRRKLHINTGDVLSISCNDSNIFLSKYSSLDNNLKLWGILEDFCDVFQLNVLLVNKEYVSYSNLIDKGLKLDINLENKVKSGINLKYSHDSFVFGNKKIDGIYNMIPIVSNEGIVGSIIVVGDEATKSYEFCYLLSKIISRELNIS